jgi:hypothetical protein
MHKLLNIYMLVGFPEIHKYNENNNFLKKIWESQNLIR